MTDQDSARQETVGDLARAFVSEPGPQSLMRLQAAVLRAPGYDPLVSVSALLDGADTPHAVLEALGPRMPGLLLSPSAHAARAQALDELGEEGPAKVEHRFARLALASLRSSGEGTEDSPYRVLRVEDEYDLLGSAGLRSTAQSARTDGRGSFDVHTLVDGGSLWCELLWRTPGRR